jgi:hypothetical protein
MSLAMTWAANRTADPVDELYGHINASRIAVAGQSCGGILSCRYSQLHRKLWELLASVKEA